MSQTYTVYLAPKDREEDLAHELGHHVLERHGRLFLCNAPVHPVYWAQNIWYDARKIPIQSIKDGAKKLRAIMRNWALYPYDYHRRCSLIEDNLPHVSAKPLNFGDALPDAPLGHWCLIDKNTILAAENTNASTPNGKYLFVEDKETPPNRAYLKLWEALTRIDKQPKKGEKTMDVGACPGGWTWVLQTLDCDVIAVDKAPLDRKIKALKNVSFLQESAFGLDPKAHGPIDWLCSDIICYPDRLYDFVQNWITTKMVRNMICTIKLQGDTDFAAIEKFAAIPNSQIIHLYNNKHELTWIWHETP